MIHHGNQQVEQHDDVDQWEAPEHNEAPEPGELLDPRELEVVQVYQAERRPEKGLCGLPEAEMRQKWVSYKLRTTLRWILYFANFL